LSGSLTVRAPSLERDRSRETVPQGEKGSGKRFSRFLERMSRWPRCGAGGTAATVAVETAAPQAGGN